MQSVFETKRLFLRKWQEEDAVDLFAMASDPAVGPAAGWAVHTSVENSREIIREVLRAEGTYAIVRKADGKLVGSIGLRLGKDACSEKMDEPELGYWIGHEFWGKGYAPEASAVLLKYAFDELNCPQVWCCYYEGNEKSKRVMEKLGFAYVRMDPKGDTLLGYTLPEVENVLTREQWSCDYS